MNRRQLAGMDDYEDDDYTDPDELEPMPTISQYLKSEEPKPDMLQDPVLAALDKRAAGHLDEQYLTDASSRDIIDPVIPTKPSIANRRNIMEATALGNTAATPERRTADRRAAAAKPTDAEKAKAQAQREKERAAKKAAAEKEKEAKRKAAEKAKAEKAKAAEKLAKEKAAAKAKAEKERAAKKAAAEKEKAERAKQREKERAERAAERAAKGLTGGMASTLRAHAKQYVRTKEIKTPGGNVSIDCGDPIAAALRGKTLDEVYAYAAKHLKEDEGALRAKYSHLNNGQQRMTLGNRVRAAAAKGH